MTRRPNQILWLLAACAALAAQAFPQAFCGECEKPCCASGGHDGRPAAADVDSRPAGGCPLCAVAVGTSPRDLPEEPCRCQLNARQHQPVSHARGTVPRFDGAEQGVIAESDIPDVPMVSGSSREFLAASLRMPIRPTRILYGVWLN